jgi:hypothetical protein
MWLMTLYKTVLEPSRWCIIMIEVKNEKKWFDAVKFVACFIGLSYTAGMFFTWGAMRAIEL